MGKEYNGITQCVLQSPFTAAVNTFSWYFQLLELLSAE